MPPVIQVRDLVKTYTVGEVTVRALARREHGRHCRRIRRDHRAVRLRQVDADAHPWMPRPADERPVHPRWQRRITDVEGRTRGDPQPEHRVRVSGFQPAVAHHGARQRGAAAALQRVAEAEDSRPAQDGHGGAEFGRSRRPSAPLPEPALRRSAAARGDRPRARDTADDPAGRRTDRQPGYAHQHRGDGHLPDAEQGTWHHDPADHARNGHRRVRHAVRPVPRRQDSDRFAGPQTPRRQEGTRRAAAAGARRAAAGGRDPVSRSSTAEWSRKIQCPC